MFQPDMRISAAIKTAHEDVSTLPFTVARPLEGNESFLIAASVIFELSIMLLNGYWQRSTFPVLKGGPHP